ncbi:MAG: efflux RND transporter periplasmic adaptor subunit [Gallionella sp.]|nr:efflux RND transporter periplasmic adaptor subunit [Gallionella sp.]
MTPKSIGILISGGVVVLLFAWVVATQGPLAPAKATVGKMQSGNLTSAVFGIGTLEAKRNYNLAPTMTGRIKTVLVDQGDSVVAGQVLAEMEPVDLDEKVNGARHAAEKAAYAILIAEAQLTEASSRLKLSSASFARYEDLSKRGFISPEMLEAKRHENDAAVAAVRASSATLAAARQDSARVHADAAGVKKLREQTQLTSPVDGVVVARLFEPGATVAAGQVVLQIIDPASLWVRTRIDQKQAGMIGTGQQAEIILRSSPQSRLAGVVERVDMISDAVTEERIVNVAFLSVQPAGNIGEAAEVTISLPDVKGASFIPSAAVKRVEKRDGVWLLQDGKVQFRAVRTGVSTLDGRTQIFEGIGKDDEFVVYSQQPLQDGLKVKVVPEIVRSNP